PWTLVPSANFATVHATAALRPVTVTVGRAPVGATSAFAYARPLPVEVHVAAATLGIARTATTVARTTRQRLTDAPIARGSGSSIARPGTGPAPACADGSATGRS